MTDAIIVGGGPAGATAAVYIARAGFTVTLIYKNLGALETAEGVENFYGFTKISGKSLVEKGLRQARAVGAKTIRREVVGLSQQEAMIYVETPRKTFESKAVLLATGAARNTPKIPGLADLEGRGVSYCAICDGFFYRGKHVAVLGSGAYALHEAQDLLPLAASVTLLTNGKTPTANFPPSVKIHTEKIQEITNKPPSTSPTLLTLNSQLSTLNSALLSSGEEIKISGLFIADGMAGSGDLARKIGAAIGEENAISVDNEMKTTISGIWAAGDCVGGLKQIVKASHDGAIAGISIANFLRNF